MSISKDERKRRTAARNIRRYKNDPDYRERHKQKQRERIAASPELRERRRLYSRKYYAASDKSKRRAADRVRWLKRQYGLTPGEFDAMLIHQLGGCAICGTELRRGRKNAHVDHCHETGQVRGLLCGACNAALGLLKDDLSSLQNAFTYILSNKARSTT